MVKRYYSDVRQLLKELYASDWEGSRGIKSRGADRVVATVGYEGSGKSNFALICLEEWYKFIGQGDRKDLVNQITATPEEFAKCLTSSKEYDMLMVDEGVLMSYARKGMSEGNVHVNNMLMVCRGKHFYFNILIPNFLDLDSYIRKNRVSGLWVMLPNFHVAYFSRKRIHQLLAKMAFQSRNGHHADPMKLGVKPNCVAKVPRYDGALAAAYDKIKQNNMNQVIESLSNVLTKTKGKNVEKPKTIDRLERAIQEDLQLGKKPQEIAASRNVSKNTVYGKMSSLRSKGIDPYGHYTKEELDKLML